jgi:predicted PurR-regulated permease PerM
VKRVQIPSGQRDPLEAAARRPSRPTVEAAPAAAVVPLHTDEQDVPTTAAGPAVQSPLPLALSFEERRILRRLARLLLICSVLFGVVWLLWTARQALLPFIVGLALAYVMLPLVNRLNQSLPRWGAILVVYAVTFLILGLAVGYIVPPLIAQAQGLIASIPAIDELQLNVDLYLNRMRGYLPEPLQGPIEQAVRRSLNTVQSNLTEYLSRSGTILLSTAGRLLDTITFVIGFLVIPFWLFYVLNDHKLGLRAVDRLLPVQIREDFWALARIIDTVFSKYIRGQLLLGVIIGVMSGVGLLVLRLFGFEVNYILALALFAGITELIPVIGPIIGAIPAIFVGLFDGLGTALAVTALYVVIQQVENQVLVPRIVGESVGIHPALTFILLAVFAQAFGLLGAILAVPVSAAIRDIVVYLNLRLSDPAETMRDPEGSPTPESDEEALLEREASA